MTARGLVRWGGLIARGVMLTSVVLGCDQSGSEKRAEVRSVSQAIDRLRQAQNADKAPLLTQLSRLPCSLADVCELRERCGAAYRLQVEALDQISGAGKDKFDGEMITLIEKKLEAARKMAHECLENELVVGRRYGTQI